LFQGGQPSSMHLLWLDTDAFNQPQLYNALIDDSLSVFRGPIQVSDSSARCYDVLTDSSGSLWAIWSGDSISNPALYSGLIDGSGLNLRIQEMLKGSGCPATVRTETAQYILWTDETAQLQIGTFLNGRLLNPHSVVASPQLNTGDTTRSLLAGSDGIWIYVFWNIKRVDGVDETWFTTALPDSDSWQPPQQLRVQVDESTTFETTYNTGDASAAALSESGIPLAWATPLPDVSTVLPVAVESNGDSLAVIYLSDGEIAGYQHITATAGLFGEPELKADRNRHLYLSWSEQTPVSAADMRITSTRQLLD